MTEWIEHLQVVAEDQAIRAWFGERCEQPGECAGQDGEWYIDHDGHTRCKQCDLKAT